MGYDSNSKVQYISFTMGADELYDTEFVFKGLFKHDLLNTAEFIEAISSAMTNAQETEKTRTYMPEGTTVFTRNNAETNEISFFVAADEEITRANEIIESIKNNDQFKEASTVTLYYVKTERLDIFSGNLDLMGCFLEEYRDINPLLYLNDYMQKLINNVLILQLK